MPRNPNSLTATMKIPYSSIFSVYGGKSKLSHLYPPPVYDQIVEPFAGGAAYSLRYWEHSVWLNDLNPRIVSMWDFLINDSDALEWINELPDNIAIGSIITEQFFGFPEGMIEILCAECNRGTAGQRSRRKQMTKVGAHCWPRLKPRLLYWLPRISHWKITTLSYNQLPNMNATWFIDPPYDNFAGTHYAFHDLDYTEVASYCQSRQGQVIVCENEGATWLPFTPLVKRRGVRSRYQQSEAMEAVWLGGRQVETDAA